MASLRLHIWALMKHNLEEHILSPGLEESSIKWIRHVSCSQIYENAILFFWLVILNSFLSGGQGNKTSLFANTFSNHSFVWKTTPFSVRFPKSIFFFFFLPRVLKIVTTMMSHLKKKKDLWVCHLFYKPIMLWREWKNSCVR